VGHADRHDTERAEKLLPLLELQPDIISNNRLDAKKLTGDYGTPENKIPTNALASDWETCMTMNGTWVTRGGQQMEIHRDADPQPGGHRQQGRKLFAERRADERGLDSRPSVERLAQVGAWMKVNGQAIYGTDKSPLPAPPAWGRVTQKGGTLYLHVFDWPKDGKLVVPGLKNQIARAYLLKPNFLWWHKKLPAANDAAGVTVSVPQNAPDNISSTVVLKLAGAPEID